MMSWYVLPIAFILDWMVGDPQQLPHPIRWMGGAIAKAEPIFRKLPVPLGVSGGLFAGTLVGGVWALTTLLLAFCQFFHPLVKTAADILILYYCLSVRDLEQSAMKVYASLKQRRLPEAKNHLAMIVGRDVQPLSETGVIRAAVETVAENLVDGVISPLFFAVLGGAPLALAYKMVNTLDSMVGYKNDCYEQFGKVSARMDDIANFVPARISIVLIAAAAKILADQGSSAFNTGLREGANHTSPNSGYPEAAFAGALNIRLGGPNQYGGSLVQKPFIGALFGEPNIEHIKKACDLMMLASVLGVILGIIAH